MESVADDQLERVQRCNDLIQRTEQGQIRGRAIKAYPVVNRLGINSGRPFDVERTFAAGCFGNNVVHVKRNIGYELGSSAAFGKYAVGGRVAAPYGYPLSYQSRFWLKR